MRGLPVPLQWFIACRFMECCPMPVAHQRLPIMSALHPVGDLSRFGGGDGSFMLQWVFIRPLLLLAGSLCGFMRFHEVNFSL